MLIKSLSLVTQSGTLRISKSFSNLVFLSKENISSIQGNIKLWVERTNGRNIDICKSGTSLRDFMTLCTYGDNIISQYNGKYIISCPISDGTFELSEDDSVKIELTGLNNLTGELDIYALQVPEFSTELRVLENKVYLSEEKERSFTTEDIDLMLIQNFSVVRYVECHYDNGISILYTDLEIRAMSMDVDALCAATPTGVLNTSNEGNVVLPLVGVDAITITKITGTVNLVSMELQNFDTSNNKGYPVNNFDVSRKDFMK